MSGVDWPKYQGDFIMVDCPDCGFSFSADHEDDEGGGYSCPVCAEMKLRQALTSIIVRCREGDSRTNWLPTISSIATEALKRTA